MEEVAADIRNECRLGEDPQRKTRSKEVADLVRTYKAGGAGAKAARDSLVMKMYPLVKSISHRLSPDGDAHLERDDLIQEGVLGLMHALERFDPELGYEFSTYAYHIVFDFMRMLVRRSRTVRLPYRLAKQTSKVRAIEGRLTAKLGRAPSVAEVAREAGVTPGIAATILSTYTVSSEIRVAQSGADLSLFDRIADNTFPSVERAAEQLRLHPRFLDALRQLPARHSEVLIRYFGLQGRPESHAEIGRDWGYTRQNVQRLAADGLKKLRRQLTSANWCFTSH